MRVKKGKYLYLEVTKDKYELPLAVADTAIELADMLKMDVSNIHKQIKKDGYIKRVTVNETDV